MNWRWQTITNALLTSVTHYCSGKLRNYQNVVGCTETLLWWQETCSFVNRLGCSCIYWGPNQQLQLTTHMAFRTAYKGVSCFSLVRKKEVLYHNQIKTRKKAKPFLWWSKRGIPALLDSNFAIWNSNSKIKLMAGDSHERKDCWKKL